MAESQTSGSNKPNDETQTTKVITTGNSVRIEAPTGKSRRRPRPRVSVINSTDEVVTGFIDFLREHAVIALALGFVMATQIQTLVKQLVDSFITPTFTLLFGKALSHRYFTLHFRDHVAKFDWGSFAYGLLNVIFVLFAIYIVVKLFKLDKLDQLPSPPPDKADQEETKK